MFTITETKPVATIIREFLDEEGFWVRGESRTSRNTHYSKNEKTIRWTTNGLLPITTDKEEKKIIEEQLKKRILDAGYHNVNTVHTWADEVLVFENTPIRIIEL